MKYPAISKILLAQYPAISKVVAGAPVVRDQNKMIPVKAKRELIKDLYGAIGERFFGMDSGTVREMHRMIDSLMSDRDVEREWEFIRSGNVEKLLMLMQQIHMKADEEDVQELEQMQKLWEDIAHGIMETKQHNQEIDDETWKFVEENLMDFADRFSDKLAKKVKKPKLNPPERKKLGEPGGKQYWETKEKKRAQHGLEESEYRSGTLGADKAEAGDWKWCGKCVRMTPHDENGKCKECGN